MKIAHIAPYNALNEISSLGDIEFCLAPYAIRIPEYMDYFIKAKEAGRFVILDNGVAEGDLIDDSQLVDLAIKMKVNELIIPDVIGDYYQTKINREVFLGKYYELLARENIKLMSVIQGEDYNMYQISLKELLTDYRIDTIGIPFRMMYATFKNYHKSREAQSTSNRELFVLTLKDCHKPIHLLGCNLPWEAVLQNRINIARSMDSKLMARYGLNNKIYYTIDLKKPKHKLYIDQPLSDEQILLSINNISKLKEEMGNGR